MNLTIRLLGCEVLAIETTKPASDNRTDVTTSAFGFSETTPRISDGRYGFDD